MEKNFTHFRRLLRYVYQEMSVDDSQSMAKEIQGNFEMQESHAEIIKGLQCLPKIQMSPSPMTIHNILHHMHITSLEAQH